MYTKSNVFKNFKNFKAFVENQKENKIKVPRSDNSTDNTNNIFSGVLQSSWHHASNNSPIHTSSDWYERTVEQNHNGKGTTHAAGCQLRLEILDRSCANGGVYKKVEQRLKPLWQRLLKNNGQEKMQTLVILKFLAVQYMHQCKTINNLTLRSKQYIFVGYCMDSKRYRLLDPQSLR